MKFLNHLQLNYNELQNATLHKATTAGAPSSPVAGTIFYNTSLNLPKWYDGNYWRDFGSVTQFDVDTTIVSGDHLVFSDESVTGSPQEDPNNKITVDNFIAAAPALLSEEVIDDGDYIMFLDGGGTGTAKKEALHDIATKFAGDGLTATSSVIDIDAAQTNITSIYNAALTIGQDSQTGIGFATSNEIDFKVDNVNRLTLTSSALYPETNNQIDLGTSTYEFKDAWFDGTVTSDAFAGPLTGNASSATVATTVTITDNENTDENNAVVFTSAGKLTGGDMGLGSDGDLYYNPLTGILTATGFAGNTTGDIVGDVTGTASLATSITATANNSTNETVYPTFVDGTTGTQGIETDTGLTYNPSTGTLEALILKGATSVQTPLIEYTDGDNAITIADGGGITAANGITSTAATNTFGVTSFNDQNITNVGDLNADSISVDDAAIGLNIDFSGGNTATSAITIADNLAEALVITQGGNDYLDICTTDSSETVHIGHGVDGVAITIGHTTSETTIADNLTVTGDLTVSGTTTTVDVEVVSTANGVVFEGSSDDSIETTLKAVNPTIADKTIQLPNLSGYVALLNTATTTTITSTPDELNVLDGVTAGTVGASLGVVVDASKDITGFRDVTLTGELDANSLDIAGDADIDGTLEADIITIDGTNIISGSVITTLGTVTAGTWQGTDVAVAHGGTGVSTLTDGGILLGSGANAITAMAVLANGEMIVGDGTTDPAVESGATLRTSIGVGTGDSPQFTSPYASTSIELGHASDTTITRTGAGAIAVEGFSVALVKAWSLNHSATGVVADNGAAASTVFTITHGMGASVNYGVEIISASAESSETIYANITRPSTTTIVVTFASTVENGTYNALVTKFPDPVD